MTGQKYIRDDGEEYKSAMNAAKGLVDRPDSTFIHSELDMAGAHTREATEEIVRYYERYYKSL